MTPSLLLKNVGIAYRRQQSHEFRDSIRVCTVYIYTRKDPKVSHRPIYFLIAAKLSCPPVAGSSEFLRAQQYL